MSGDAGNRAGSETLTIVFTDLVDSTATRAALGEEDADRLGETHMTMLTGVVGRHDGRVVKRTGDGVLAVFDSAVDAIDAAIVMQQEADRYSSDDEAIAPTPIRVGISTGDVTWDANGDVAGAAAVEAKRLESAANAGQILCSELTRLIARGRGGHVFAEMGELELKGFPEPVVASEVLWERRDARSDHPLPPALAVEPDRFVGRDVELQTARRAVAVAPHAPATAVVVAGEPGIGKTTLASLIARETHQAGRVALFGRCDPQLAAPYRPFAEAIDHWARHDGGRTLGDGHRLLGRISPVVADALGVPSVETDSRTAQLALFDAVLSWCAEVRPLLVIDDLQWATEQTVLLVRHLVQSTEPTGTVLLATVRSDEQPNHLRACLDDAVSRDRATVVHLEGLEVEHIRTLTGAEAPEVLAARTGGNPLFLRALTSADDTATSLEAAVARRVRMVDEDVHRVLRLAAVAGLEFEPSLLTKVLDLDEDELLEHLDAAVAAGLVREQALDRFSFSHGLVQEALANELGRTRRARLHQRLAAEIEATDPSRVAELARHYDEAGVTDKAIEYLTVAADRADELADWETAERLHRRLQELHTDPRLELRHQWGAVNAIRYSRWITPEVHAEAVAICDRAHELGETLVEVRASVTTTIFINQTGRRPNLDHIRRIDVDRIDDPDAKVQAVTNLAYTEFLLGLCTTEEAHDRIHSVHHLLDQAESLSTEAWFGMLGMTQTEPDKVEISRAAMDESLRVSREANAPELHISMVSPGVAQHLMAGDRASAERVLRAADDFIRGRFEPFHHLMLDVARVNLFHVAGRFDDAHAALDAVEAEADQVAQADMSGISGVQRFMVLREQGRLSEIAGPIQVLSRLDPDAARTWRTGLAAIYADLGMAEDARRTVREVLDGDGIPARVDARYLATLSFLADASAVTGDVDAARHLDALLSPHVGLHVVMTPTAYFGPVSRHVGLLARVLGDHDRSEELLRRAVEESRGLPTPVYEARASVDLAELLAAIGRRGDAVEHARCALGIGEELGMATVARRAHALLGPGST